MGRKVKSLVNEVQNSGVHSVIWDATNHYGKSVSAGLYLYKVSAGNFQKIEKMIFLK